MKLSVFIKLFMDRLMASHDLPINLWPAIPGVQDGRTERRFTVDQTGLNGRMLLDIATWPPTLVTEIRQATDVIERTIDAETDPEVLKARIANSTLALRSIRKVLTPVLQSRVQP
jgi:hypothetical protein